MIARLTSDRSTDQGVGAAAAMGAGFPSAVPTTAGIEGGVIVAMVHLPAHRRRMSPALTRRLAHRSRGRLVTTVVPAGLTRGCPRAGGAAFRRSLTTRVQ